MDNVERKILRAIEEGRETILNFARAVYRCPELAGCEEQTAGCFADALRKLGYLPQTGLCGHGVRARIHDGRPSVALIGELDAIACPQHPAANPDTGAAHACGHFAQLASVLGAAIALRDPEVRAALDGQVELWGVPAEESLGGKIELIRAGLFDQTDAAVTTHAHYAPCAARLLLGSMRNNGIRHYEITMRGLAAHAGGAPHMGVNALSAVSVALTAIGLQRETYRDEDNVRVHGNICRGGSVCNVVPDRIDLVYGVRANNAAALEDADRKTRLAFSAGALAMGATVNFSEENTYLPMRFRAATDWQEEIAAMLLPPEQIARVSPSDFNSVSTDVGNLSEKMPVLNFTTGGFTGALHSPQFTMTDPETAVLLPARMMALSAYRLLRHGSEEIRKLQV